MEFPCNERDCNEFPIIAKAFSGKDLSNSNSNFPPRYKRTRTKSPTLFKLIKGIRTCFEKLTMYVLFWNGAF